MTNNDSDERIGWLEDRLLMLGWSDAPYWLPILAPFIYLVGLHDHDRGLMAFGFLPFTMGVACAAALLIWQAPFRTPPRSRRDRAAMVSLGLAPLLGFAIWPGDPLSFEPVRTLEPICIAAASATVVAALILRAFPPRLSRVVAFAGAAVDFALIAAYVDILLLRSHPSGSADLAVWAAILLAPFALAVALLGAWLVLVTVLPPPERAP